MSRGGHFARPSVHRAINFGHKASPALEKLDAPSWKADSPSELLTHMHLSTAARIDVLSVRSKLPFDLV